MDKQVHCLPVHQMTEFVTTELLAVIVTSQKREKASHKSPLIQRLHIQRVGSHLAHERSHTTED